MKPLDAGGLMLKSAGRSAFCAEPAAASAIEILAEIDATLPSFVASRVISYVFHEMSSLLRGVL